MPCLVGDTLANNKHSPATLVTICELDLAFRSLVFSLLLVCPFLFGVHQFIAGPPLHCRHLELIQMRPALQSSHLPNAVIIGFISSFLGGLVAMALMVCIPQPNHHDSLQQASASSLVVLAAFCGYAWWMARCSSWLLVGIFLTLGPLILYPALLQLGICRGIASNVDWHRWFCI